MQSPFFSVFYSFFPYKVDDDLQHFIDITSSWLVNTSNSLRRGTTTCFHVVIFSFCCLFFFFLSWVFLFWYRAQINQQNKGKFLMFLWVIEFLFSFVLFCFDMFFSFFESLVLLFFLFQTITFRYSYSQDHNDTHENLFYSLFTFSPRVCCCFFSFIPLLCDNSQIHVRSLQLPTAKSDEVGKATNQTIYAKNKKKNQTHKPTTEARVANAWEMRKTFLIINPICHRLNIKISYGTLYLYVRIHAIFGTN